MMNKELKSAESSRRMHEEGVGKEGLRNGVEVVGEGGVQGYQLAKEGWQWHRTVVDEVVLVVLWGGGVE